MSNFCSQDPLQIWYRIGWIYKQGATNQSDPITMEEVKMRLTESLMKTQGYIDRYHINMNEINIGRKYCNCFFIFIFVYWVSNA